jgi:REP element-mobilizing transposase RayT
MQPLPNGRGSDHVARSAPPHPVYNTRGQFRIGGGLHMGEPLGYLLTWTCYGTWLHGDERGSVDRLHNAVDAPGVTPNVQRRALELSRCEHAPVHLDAAQRAAVQAAIVQVCTYRGWTLHELNVRSNHVHAVVSAPVSPERVANDFKAYSTRRLRAENLIGPDVEPWTRGCSRRYLWKPEQVAAACRYVLDGQGGDLD